MLVDDLKQHAGTREQIFRKKRREEIRRNKFIDKYNFGYVKLFNLRTFGIVKTIFAKFIIRIF